jgi:hypothetical protein
MKDEPVKSDTEIPARRQRCRGVPRPQLADRRPGLSLTGTSLFFHREREGLPVKFSLTDHELGAGVLTPPGSPTEGLQTSPPPKDARMAQKTYGGRLYSDRKVATSVSFATDN